MGVRASLEPRVRHILRKQQKRTAASVASTAAMAVVLAVLTVPLAAVQDQPLYHIGDEALTPPVPTYTVKPQYPPQALAERLEGTVLLQLEVSLDGLPENIRVTQPLDEELDAAAVEATRQWRFEPGRKDDAPVRVEVAMEMTFRLK
jgi:TonB family protein